MHKEKWEKIFYTPLQRTLIVMLLQDYDAGKVTALDDVVEIYARIGKRKPQGDARRSAAGVLRYTSAKIEYIDCRIKCVTKSAPYVRAEYMLDGRIDLLRKSLERKKAYA